jgi:tripartite-type tricarboxylate transporter receptor subunit TctC
MAMVPLDRLILADLCLLEPDATQSRHQHLEGTVMNLLRRRFLHLAATAASAAAFPRPASALDYPVKPVRLIVPFAPAGGSDIFARLVGGSLAERFGQQFVIENRPGAASSIGTEVVVRASPDGYTLLLASSANAAQQCAACNSCRYSRSRPDWRARNDQI